MKIRELRPGTLYLTSTTVSLTYENLMYVPQIKYQTMRQTQKTFVNTTLFEKYVDP